MPKPKRVLCIMDFSLVGRAGLGVALPVLAACGVQGCALPSALFSAHTGGFGTVQRQSEAAFGQKALAHFAREGVSFDAVYTGYLYGDDQFALAKAALAQYPSALHLVDPAMGDDGKLYTGLGDGAVARMAALANGASLITPNYTESALLCGEAPTLAPPSDEELRQRLGLLAQNGRSVLITSVPTQKGGWCTAGCEAGGKNPFTILGHHVPQRYPGTGDTLAAALCGLLLRHPAGGLQAAAEQATRFVEAAAAATYKGGGTPRQGLWLEPLLHMLHEPPNQ